MTQDAARRSGPGRLLSGALWNALGRGLPLLLALALTPWLLQLMGIERWGLFTLALAVLGVMGVLDLGVGAALTRALSERMADAGAEEQAALVRAAIAVLALVGLAGAALVWAAIPWLTTRLLNIPPALQEEGAAALAILALAIPLVVVNAALWGVLAAYQRFAAANLVTVPVNLLYYLGPLATLLVWQSLVPVMIALLLCRLVNTLSYAWLIGRDLPSFWRGRPRLSLAAPLLSIGGWITLAALIGQALLYADRFVIGALLSLQDVAHYATPLDLIIRFWILPVAVAQALLPAMAAAYRGLPAATAELLRRGGLIILALVFPAALIVGAAAEALLALWLGRDFAASAAPVLALFAVGILFSCFAYAPNALLEAIGRPDVTARFVLAQALVFIPASVAAVAWGGITAAAALWSMRVAVDALGKLFFAARLYPAAAPAASALLPPLLAGGAVLALLTLLPGPGWRMAAALAGLLVLAPLLWRALSAEERAILRNPRSWPGLMRIRP
ncbi:MAG: oligosaccharide flippase family protein [Rhodovarius sp.]|nr:oligosaccharide flippase family protein [Rhodovarius sp.]